MKTPAKTSVAKRAKPAYKYKSPSVFKVSRGLGRPTTGIPEQMKITLRYVENTAFSVVAGVGYSVWTANGMYDPRVAAGGHQPMYFDQMMAIYGHYVVTSSKCTLTYVSSNTGDVSIVGWIDNDGGFPVTTKADWEGNCERPGAKLTDGTPSVAPLKPIVLYWNSKVAFGGSEMANDELHGTSSANPVEMQYFCYSLWDNSVASYNGYFNVEIEYTATLFERTTAASS